MDPWSQGKKRTAATVPAKRRRLQATGREVARVSLRTRPMWSASMELSLTLGCTMAGKVGRNVIQLRMGIERFVTGRSTSSVRIGLARRAS
jgi:hypothetical protein